MQNDTNTYGYNQWFYFSLRGVKKNTLYRFVIPNMVNPIIGRGKDTPSFGLA